MAREHQGVGNRQARDALPGGTTLTSPPHSHRRARW
jgi:hypothetical protein